MRTEGKAVLLREHGFSEEEIENILSGLEQEFGTVSTRLIAENIMVDQITGRVRVTKRVEKEYSELFVRAGLNLSDHLWSRNAFFKAFRLANRVSLDNLIQSGHELPFLK